MTKTEIIITVVGVILSFGLGLIPFFIAKKKGAIRYGVSALGLCIFAGLFMSIFGSLPLAVLLTVIALACSPERLKSLGEKEPDGIKDVAIFLSVLIVLAGVLVLWAFQVGAIG